MDEFLLQKMIVPSRMVTEAFCLGVEMTKSVIANIGLIGPYSEGFTYQDNLLPKYQARLGYEVYYITNAFSWSKSGELHYVGKQDYVNTDGVHVIRLDNDQKKDLSYRFRTHSNLQVVLDRIGPQIVFLHGCQTRDASIVVRYLKAHPDCRLFVDNHADASNSATNWLSKYVLHRVIWGHYAKMLQPYAARFWGVLPARVDFLIENYGIPREQCELLVMGADDDEVVRASTVGVRKAVRENLGFKKTDFIVVTGGKIDLAKAEVLDLMDAVLGCGENVKLLMFGPVVPELEDAVSKRAESDKITWLSWASASESYDYFGCANIACFPGRHSVYWEQAAGMGVPLILKRWDGTDHIDVCGNVLFLDGGGIEPIEVALRESMADHLDQQVLWRNAEKAATCFLYSDIARRSIGRAG